MPLDAAFQARVWVYEGSAVWYFVTLPRDLSAQIHSQAAGRFKPGGSLRVTATVGRTRWRTSIFRDRKQSAYLLPLKASVRAKEQLRPGDLVEVVLLAELAGD
jgi:hypothetical protein